MWRLFNIITGTELKYDSIAEAAKYLKFKTYSFNSLCSTISCCCSHKMFNVENYIFRYANDKYVIPVRKSAIIDISTNIIYKNRKEAAQAFNLSTWQINKLIKTKKLQFISDCARLKLCESGKLFTDK